MNVEKKNRKRMSGQQRLAATELALEKLKMEAREAKRQLQARVNAICGAAWLEAGEHDPTFKSYLMAKLRTSSLSARDLAEVAHLLIEDGEQSSQAISDRAQASDSAPDGELGVLAAALSEAPSRALRPSPDPSNSQSHRILESTGVRSPEHKMRAEI